MKKYLVIVGALVSAFFMAAPALAATTVSIDQNPVPIPTSGTNTTVNVSWTGLPAGTRVFITQCFKPVSDPTFDPFASCSNLSEVTVNPSDNPGSGTTSFPVFYGPEPSGDDSWGCFGAGDTAPSGIAKNTTCYIRVTDNAETNLTDQQSVAFTFGPSTPVPESHLPIALPLVGVAVAGASLEVMRRRRTRTAV